MTGRLLICTDLDRTLVPNGPQAESPGAREHFAALVARPEVTLAYVSGRHRALVAAAISEYQLPLPEYVIGDVGTTIYRVGTGHEWASEVEWQTEIAQDWAGKTRGEIELLLRDIADLQLQESEKQNDYKLSYYLPLQSEQSALAEIIYARLLAAGVKANLVWSIDEMAGIGLLDVLPARASKYHAIEALMKLCSFDYSNTVFCGDSGNDIEVLASPIAAVLVANSQKEVRELANRLAKDDGFADQLYIARGNFMNMNGNYSAGMLEGIAHYHPHTVDWMALTATGEGV